MYFYSPIKFTALIALLSLCAIELVFLFGFLFKTYHPMPWHDEWHTIRLFQSFYIDGWNLKGMLSLHNEHRLFIPRVIYAIDFYFFNALNIFTILVSLLLLFGIAAIYIVQILSLRFTKIEKIFSILGIFCFLLSGLQLSNLLWAFQVQWYLTYFFGLIALYFLSSINKKYLPINIFKFYLWSIIFVMISSFSTAAGLFLWAPVILITLLNPAIPKRFVYATIIIAILTAYFYLTNFPVVDVAKRGIDSIDNLESATRFLLIFLGSPFSVMGTNFASLMGFLFILIYTAGGWVSLRGGMVLNRVQIFCFATASYYLIIALVTAFGRYHLGLNGASESRFITIGLIGWGAIFLCGYLFLQTYSQPASHQFGMKKYLTRSKLIFLLALLMSLVGLSGYVWPQYDYFPLRAIKSKAALDLVNDRYDTKAVAAVGLAGSANQISELVKFLKENQKSFASEKFSKFLVSEETENFKQIDLRRRDLPIKIYGLSQAEPFGRWSNSKIVILEFPRKLPQSFKFRIVCGAVGKNIGEKLKVISGDQEEEIVIGVDISNMRQYEINFHNVIDSNLIVLIIPSPAVAGENDPRKIGVAIQSIQISQ
jgi:hypothetical protein